MTENISFHWFRRDLRLSDNAALYHALKSGQSVIALFIFDTEILKKLDNKSDRRVSFIYSQLQNLKKELKNLNSDLLVLYGKPAEVWLQIIQKYNVKSVFTNHDYEPSAIKRDLEIEQLLTTHHISFHSFKDQCIFEKNEVLSQQGKPYTVFTPYSKAWKSKLNNFYTKPYPTEKYFTNFQKNLSFHFPSFEEIGFKITDYSIVQAKINPETIQNYAENRDFPSIDGTSKLSVHLRFGTVSIRKLASEALLYSETWLNELIWRDFYMNILFHFPHVVFNAFKPDYDSIKWRNNEQEFTAWCEGKTGYPIVDAGMRELNETGFMHNRVRMITASFLTKHLLIDWRWGEAYFASKLLDYDLSANNGGWQWAASSGCDAVPYFRIFNPTLQTQKFDPKYKYIKKWISDFNSLRYPQPIVNHEFARERCLKVYQEALNKKN